MRAFLVLSAGLSVACGLPAFATGDVPVWEVDPAHSAVRFRVKLMGGTIRGRFQRFDVDIALDPERPEQGRIRAEIDVASVDTRNAERDVELRKADWFDVGAFPRASFESVAVRRAGDGYEVEGWLSLRGERQRVIFPFRIERAANGGRRLDLSGEATLDRRDFGIGGGKWNKPGLVGNEVEVIVELSGTLPAP